MACEFCERDGGRLIWRGDECRVVLVDEPGYAGYCRVIWNAHVREMTDLAEPERLRYLRLVFDVEHALRELLAPDKINLASLGNVTPHLHWHIVPRFRDDPHFPNPIWGATVRPPSAPVRSSDEIVAGLARKLSR